MGDGFVHPRVIKLFQGFDVCKAPWVSTASGLKVFWPTLVPICIAGALIGFLGWRRWHTVPTHVWWSWANAYYAMMCLSACALHCFVERPAHPELAAALIKLDVIFTSASCVCICMAGREFRNRSLARGGMLPAMSVFLIISFSVLAVAYLIGDASSMAGWLGFLYAAPLVPAGWEMVAGLTHAGDGDVGLQLVKVLACSLLPVFLTRGWLCHHEWLAVLGEVVSVWFLWCDLVFGFLNARFHLKAVGPHAKKAT